MRSFCSFSLGSSRRSRSELPRNERNKGTSAPAFACCCSRGRQSTVGSERKAGTGDLWSPRLAAGRENLKVSRLREKTVLAIMRCWRWNQRGKNNTQPRSRQAVSTSKTTKFCWRRFKNSRMEMRLVLSHFNRTPPYRPLPPPGVPHGGLFIGQRPHLLISVNLYL